MGLESKTETIFEQELEKRLDGWYACYTGSHLLGLSEKPEVVAYTKVRAHAIELIQRYGQYGSIEKVKYVKYLE